MQYWDAATGKLDRVETVQERWSRVGKLDLPTRHTVTTSSDAGLSVRSVDTQQSRTPEGGSNGAAGIGILVPTEDRGNEC